MFTTDKPSDCLTSHDIYYMSHVCSQGLIIIEIAINSRLMFYPAGDHGWPLSYSSLSTTWCQQNIMTFRTVERIAEIFTKPIEIS